MEIIARPVEMKDFHKALLTVRISAPQTLLQKKNTEDTVPKTGVVVNS